MRGSRRSVIRMKKQIGEIHAAVVPKRELGRRASDKTQGSSRTNREDIYLATGGDRTVSAGLEGRIVNPHLAKRISGIAHSRHLTPLEKNLSMIRELLEFCKGNKNPGEVHVASFLIGDIAKHVHERSSYLFGNGYRPPRRINP